MRALFIRNSEFSEVSPFFKPRFGTWLAVILGVFALGVFPCAARDRDQSDPGEIRIVELQGTVEVLPAGAATWVLTQTNQTLHPADQLRTGANSRAAVLWSDQSVITIGALANIEVLQPPQAGGTAGMRLVKGIISFFHRDKPGQMEILTRGAVAGIEGTEFVMSVSESNSVEQTSIFVIDGKVHLSNDVGSLTVVGGESAVAEPGKAPTRTAGFVVNNVLQWCFYYPAVLDLSELGGTGAATNGLAGSLEAYRGGDLLQALAKYPARPPGSETEHIYHAALLLGVGQAEDAEKELAGMGSGGERSSQLSAALRRLIAAVKHQKIEDAGAPHRATEFLAGSYYEQSRSEMKNSLSNALDQARQAVTISPQFGFGWARVAELEFSFGNNQAALEALDKSLSLAPRNAQALALKGFLLAGKGRPKDAIVWFDQAIAVDAALGNAWLGRGLCRIHDGDTADGRKDLLVAAALEPQRAGLRSYLGKAYADAGDYARADKELALAKKMDPEDPTAWLYAALADRDENRINDAVRELEKSQELNDNRAVYRSQMLLDQDRAVRAANLAVIYKDAGMSDLAVREASRAVGADYANYSAHLFLANSYEELRDPNYGNLRYETAAYGEYLLANLLAPANAGLLSPAVSQQEYSSLFERDRLGVVSSTEYLSRGAWKQTGAQFGFADNLSYDVEAFYHFDPGQQFDDDIEERQLVLRLKHQWSPQDTVYFEVEDYETDKGDLAQRYDPAVVDGSDFRVRETQRPFLTFGYNHEWSPGVHTLLLLNRLDDYAELNTSFIPTLLFFRPDAVGQPGTPELSGIHALSTQEALTSQQTIYSAELQQIWERPTHTTVVGGRFQYGSFRTTSLQRNPSQDGAVFDPQPGGVAVANQDLLTVFRRLSFYGYQEWQVLEPLQLVAGVSYDRETVPLNITSLPLTPGSKTLDQVSPKAGLIWTPAPGWAARYAYTRSLSGPSFEQSFRLEPVQVAGFIQAFRSLIPEAVVGPNGGAEFETHDLSLEKNFSTGTYLALSGELLNSTDHRERGILDYLPDEIDFPFPSGTRENLDYQEESLQVTANQLLGREWALGLRYRVSHADLKDDFPDIPEILPGGVLGGFVPRQEQEALLHQLDLFATYSHVSGFYARAEALWRMQDNEGAGADSMPGDDFWQFNAYAGYRFHHRKADLTLGLLNIGDQDYRLNPLNVQNGLPRGRTLVVRLQINF